MEDTVTLLFTSAGRRNQLIDCFRQDATLLGMRVRVLAADLSPELSSACRQADASFAVPRCTDAQYVPALIEICRREKVGLLIPTIDTELPVLSMHRETFAALGVHVVISSPDVVELARDKLATCRLFASHGISTPSTASLADYLRDSQLVRWPVIAKPNSGSASSGIVRPANPIELEMLNADDYIVQELWQGREYTVNVFFDAAGRLRCAVPHWRIEVRAGEVSKGRTERLPALAAAAARLPAFLPGARGPLCFQAVVRETGDYAIFEMNARFGGGYPLAHRAGARISQWILEEQSGRKSTAHDNWRDGMMMLRYDAAVFVDA
ncbi:MAG: ATP-grasp domain-containing protein [Steroidobacteraceae bacterium]